MVLITQHTIVQGSPAIDKVNVSSTGRAWSPGSEQREPSSVAREGSPAIDKVNVSTTGRAWVTYH